MRKENRQAEKVRVQKCYIAEERSKMRRSMALEKENMSKKFAKLEGTANLS